MVSVWHAIAKAEFLVWSSRFRRFRFVVLPIIYMAVFGWALFIAPIVMNFIVTSFLGEAEMLLSIVYPGLLRSAMLFLFMLVMIGPISNSLEEIKIGQWEILLSNNVRTRDILLGTYLAKIPVFGLLVFILAPVIISPFAIIYEVSIIGQFMMYLIVLAFALVTLWISNILGTMIQAKLGDSPRGNDIAKGFSWLMIIFIAIPGMALLYFMDSFAATMSIELALFLPSTWGADLLTWASLLCSEAYIPASTLLNFESILCFSPLVTLGIFVVFSLSVVYLGLQAGDRLFVIGAGARTERVVTIKKENIIYRGLRRILPRSFGIIVLTSLKDFTRKMQNVSKLIYAMFLTIVIPILMSSGVIGPEINDPNFIPILSIVTSSLMLGIFSGITFGGVGFMDSQDQLWILKGTPNGDLRFIAGRVFSYILFALPIAFIPSTTSWLILGHDTQVYLLMFLNIFLVIVASVFVGIGVTAFNPSYDDTKSGAFTINTIVTILILLITMMVSLIIGMRTIFAEVNLIVAIVLCSIPVPIIGVIILAIGSIRMYLRDG
ncbi:MAG: hypothetical protein ACFFED_04360 [Candidatus Thorarchaeota archaeon]